MSARRFHRHKGEEGVRLSVIAGHLNHRQAVQRLHDDCGVEKNIAHYRVNKWRSQRAHNIKNLHPIVELPDD